MEDIQYYLGYGFRIVEFCHIPFIQTGAAIVIENDKGEILLQERTDRNKWGLPGGCQELGEDLRENCSKRSL